MNRGAGRSFDVVAGWRRQLRLSVLSATLLLLGAPIMTRAAALPNEAAIPEARVRLGVMGDSNSHSYQDRYSFPLGSMWRGGPTWQRATLQWTEVLARLRADQFDPGPWGTWGQSGRIAQLRDWLGLPARSPKKEDYLYNFAASGASCDDLMVGRFRQAPRLAELIRAKPDSWRDGVVVVRIGIIDIGLTESLQAMSVDPGSLDLQRKATACVGRIRAAVDLLRAAQPSLRFVIVGVFNDANDPLNNDKWQSPIALANIEKGLGLLNDPLRAMARSDPTMHYFDDQAWFRGLWGSRDARGRPAYKVVQIGHHLKVENSLGDAPTNSIVQDDHGGLVWNALWAKSLVDLLNTSGPTRIPAITETELVNFVERQLAVAR